MKQIALTYIVLFLVLSFETQAQHETFHRTKYLLDTSIIKPASLYPSEKNQKIIYHLLVTAWEDPVIFSLAVVVGNDTTEYFQETSSFHEDFISDATTSAEKDSALREKKEYFL